MRLVRLSQILRDQRLTLQQVHALLVGVPDDHSHIAALGPVVGRLRRRLKGDKQLRQTDGIKRHMILLPRN